MTNAKVAMMQRRRTTLGCKPPTIVFRQKGGKLVITSKSWTHPIVSKTNDAQIDLGGPVSIHVAPDAQSAKALALDFEDSMFRLLLIEGRRWATKGGLGICYFTFALAVSIFLGWLVPSVYDAVVVMGNPFKYKLWVLQPIQVQSV